MRPPAILLLAAGGSSRMGRPKQFIPYQGRALILHTLDQLFAVKHSSLTVLLGAYEQEIREFVAPHYPHLSCLSNPEWQEGMGSSLRRGVNNIQSHFPETGHLLLALADQPLILSHHYQALLQASAQNPDKIIAAAFGEWTGPPVLFPRKYFSLLAEAQGDQGARKWLRMLSGEVVKVALPEAAKDWDRPTDVIH